MAPVIRPAKLSHLGLRTNNLEAMAKWYHQMLAGEIIYENSDVAFVKCDEEFIRLALFQIPNTINKNAQSNGLEHFAFSFDTLGDLCNMYKERKEAGFIPYRAVHHGPTISMYYYDPDGNKLEMQTEIITSVEEFNKYKDTGAIARNPVGVEMDPEEILRAFESGRGDTLIERPDIGVRGFDHIK